MKKKLIEKLPERLKEVSGKTTVDAYEKAETLILDVYAYRHFNRRICLTDKEVCVWDGAIWNESAISYKETQEKTVWTEGSNEAIYKYASKIGADWISDKPGMEWANVRAINNKVYTCKAMQRENARKRWINYHEDMTPEALPQKLTERLENRFKDDYITLGKKSYCTACGGYVTNAEGHKANEEGTCPFCKAKIKYTRKRLDKTEKKQEYCIMQKTYDGDVVVRHFETKVYFKIGAPKKVFWYEKARIYLSPDFSYKGKLLAYYNNYTGTNYWWNANEYGTQIQYGNKTILIDVEKEIMNEEAETVFKALADNDIPSNIKNSLYAPLHRLRMCEKLAKVGMKKLCCQIATDGWDWPYIDFRAAELKKALGISKDMLRWAIKNDIGKGELLVLQEGFKNNYGLNLEAICTLAKAKISIKRLSKICEKQKIIKLFNYLAKQTCYKTLEECLQHYEDYYNMLREFHMNLERDTVRYPRNLKSKHDELLEQHNIKSANEKEQKKNLEFVAIAARQQSLIEKYGYKDEEFEIRIPRNAGEIIREGRELHHCVGGDNYLKKHAEGESAIVFLRHTAEPEKPYYTIEVIGARIVQYYGVNDSKPDKAIVDKFLTKWKAAMKKGLEHGNNNKQLSAVQASA